MENLDKSEVSKNLIRILKGSVASILLTIILLFIFSILLTYTSLQENIINPVLIIITAISILIGSSISTIKIKKNGLLNGGLVGFIYIFLIYIISSITISGFSLGIYSIVMVLVSIIAGMVGRNNRS